jgi:hypothetical protein
MGTVPIASHFQLRPDPLAEMQFKDQQYAIYLEAQRRFLGPASFVCQRGELVSEVKFASRTKSGMGNDSWCRRAAFPG